VLKDSSQASTIHVAELALRQADCVLDLKNTSVFTMVALMISP